ncbi:netrin receptor UNC5C-like isoform X2 [Watersipora subatra]|uniref:netrin receptor UNC5C-like isoform X2 n=1 Tax=Watersipora subatra TaxID=2589382 RepID=UPI00355BDCFE
MSWLNNAGYILLMVLLVISSQEVQSKKNGKRKDAGDEEADSVFTLQPEPIYYVSTKRSATIKCAAKTAAYIHIKCRDTYIEDSEISKSTATISGIEILTVSSEVTKNTIFEILARYTCVCIAVLDEGERQVRSSAGEFRIAHLEKKFPQSPIEISQEFGTEAVLICRAPDGTPEPYIFWKKNNVRIDAESYPSKYLVTSEGSLVISDVNAQDEGNYTCVADNEFFTRSTEPAKLHVYRNGGWSQWANWEECDTVCGNGYQKRRRQCDSPPPSGRDGQRCDGQDVQSSPCTKHCSPVDGGWSEWGPWGECDHTSCQVFKRRKCDNPPTIGEGKVCPGADFQMTNCSEQICSKPGQRNGFQGNNEVDSQNIILWVVLCAAVAVFAIILVIIVMCLMKKKLRHDSVYENRPADVESRDSRDGEKFDNTSHGISTQPDIMASMPLRHQRSYATSRTDSVGTGSEKMPMISSNSRPLPTQREYYMQISPNTNCDAHDYMQIGSGGDSDESGDGDDKLSHHSSSPESGICNSSDRQSIASGASPTRSELEALAWANITHVGGRLCIVDTGVSMTVPEGAIGRNQTEEVFIASLREDKEKPSLLEKQTLLSPVIFCGPQETTFNKSLIISFDHCASLKLGQWKLSIYSSNSAYDEPTQWKRLVTLNQELLHMPVFCQLDSNRCHIMVDQLASRYCLVGESMYGSKAVKQLKLAAFAQPFSSSLDSCIRVYVLPDTQDAFCNVVQQESKLGAKLMDRPKQIAFQDGGHSLCLMIDSISNGWASKMPAQYQEIPFRHIWNAHSNLHCSFAFERVPNHPNSTLSCKIQVYQKSVLSNRQQININGGSLESSFKVVGQKDLSSTVTVNTQSSSGCSSMVAIDNRDQQIFRLPTALKKKLANHLDMTCMRGNDWRMLAAALSSDRQLNFFASKPSPTEAVLDLWEARITSEEAPVAELINILRAMGRQDAVSVLEQNMGNAWV